jgi:drug/metabolite transporter (DMT)-like permease
MTIAAFLCLGEVLGLAQLIAVGLVSVGIMILSLGAGATASRPALRAPPAWPLPPTVCLAGWACALRARSSASRPALRS